MSEDGDQAAGDDLIYGHANLDGPPPTLRSFSRRAGPVTSFAEDLECVWAREGTKPEALTTESEAPLASKLIPGKEKELAVWANIASFDRASPNAREDVDGLEDGRTMDAAEALNVAARSATVVRPRARLADSAFGVRHRVLDLAIAMVLLPLLLPLMLAIAFVVSVQDRGPIVFGHVRVGRGGRMFRCWKFRSMVTDAETRLQQVLDTDPTAREEWDRDHKLRNDPRITPLGRFLRSSSLDELPQLYNVLIGDMSIVGPRPIVRAEINRYGRRFDDYCRVRPGITGLWQVSGRNDTSYRRRVAIDSHYARGKSVVGDIAILARTVPAVLARRGSY